MNNHYRGEAKRPPLTQQNQAVMNKTKTQKFLILLFFCGSSLWSVGQVNYKQAADSYVTIAGTSTLHDWTMTSLELNVQASLEASSTGIAQLKSLTVIIPATSLKSAHKAMDKNAYTALKTDKFKSIQFTVLSATIQKNVVQTSGNLTIAGVTKPVQIEATCSNNNGTLICTGSKKIKMSDFQVEAPVFMFGTVKTGDEITISFNLPLAAVKI